MSASSGRPPASHLASPSGSPLADPSGRPPAGRPSVSRCGLLAGATGLSLGGAVYLSGVAATPAAASPLLWERPGWAGAPRVGGLHLQFGSDASRQVVVSWHTTSSVSNPRVVYGTSHGGFGRTEQAETRTHRDAMPTPAPRPRCTTPGSPACGPTRTTSTPPSTSEGAQAGGPGAPACAPAAGS
ncbi:fibronectin type III domain-containing protein [Kitasatospora sp. NPDC059648]|uniref:fibronectin type III domain-containing protein n=1 Tax=Kitasatospora sp. NPDC059648 TaxID=3346894 RepID=UPI0036B6C2FC